MATSADKLAELLAGLVRRSSRRRGKQSQDISQETVIWFNNLLRDIFFDIHLFSAVPHLPT